MVNNPLKDTDSYTRDEIEAIIFRFIKCIDSSNISYKDSRNKNIDFLSDYSLSFSDRKTILKSVSSDNYLYCIPDTTPQQEHIDLFCFSIVRRLVDIFGNESDVLIYIKFKILFINKEDYAINISCHEAENIEPYCFS